MDRDELIEKAKAFNRQFPNPPENWDANGTAETMADFALGMFEAGQRAEREWIIAELDDLPGDRFEFFSAYANFIDDLRGQK